MKKWFVCSLFVVFIVGVFFCGEDAKIETPPLIRLHILAHSDQQVDQDLKYRVRDEVSKIMRQELGQLRNIKEARAVLAERLSFLKETVEEYIAGEGFPYSVQVAYGHYDFPRKDYQTFVLPAGRYEAVRFILGEGRGANWWCVLFPPLCFVEGSENLCLEEDWENILKEAARREQKVQIKPALKVVEVWQEFWGKK